MKFRILFSLITSFMFAGAGQAHAASFDVVTKVGKIRYHEAANANVGSQGNVWFLLENPSVNPGSCPQFQGKYLIYFDGGGDNAMAVSMLLTAKASNLDVEVTVDDTKLFGGLYCALQYLSIP